LSHKTEKCDLEKEKGQITYKHTTNTKTTKNPQVKRKKNIASTAQPPRTGLQAAPQPKGPNGEPHGTTISRKDAAATEEKNKHANHAQPHNANCKKWGINNHRIERTKGTARKKIQKWH
jgi:hypothetical protein